MSFALATEAIVSQAKTVTRRNGWWDLKPGDIVQPVLKAMGLKKGEEIQPLGCPIEIISVRKEYIRAITKEDLGREGFPKMTMQGFVDLLCKTCGLQETALINRIEFRYTVPNAEAQPCIN